MIRRDWPAFARASLAPLATAALSACTGAAAGPGDGQTDGGGVSLPGTGGAVSGGPVATPAFAPGGPVLARLTNEQYGNVIRDLFGALLPVAELETPTRPHLFSVIGAATDSVSERGVALFGEAAHGVAQAAFSDPVLRAAIVPCAVTTPLEEACLRRYVQDFGLKAWRRPLEPVEVDSYAGLRATLPVGDAWQLLQDVTAALLQSPNFLYRVETGEPDPEHPAWLRYSGYEMASRLSFLLRNTTPDAELLAAAARGELIAKAGVVGQTSRLLGDAEPTRAMLSQLYSEYLDLPNLDDITFPAAIDPDGGLGASMRTELLELVSRVALQEASDMRTLFNTRVTQVDAGLANLYGLPAPPLGSWQVAEHAVDGTRAGILSSGALLTLNNRPERTAPTLRGLFVRQRLLCGTVPPPPPGVPTIAEGDASEPQTIREKVDAHRTNPVCNACHQSMDPLGLGMEDFDQFGRFRTNYEAGQPVDSSGDLDGVAFAGARQLGELLANDERTTQCLVRQLYRYASARVETDTEERVLGDLHAGFAKSGFQLKPLLVELTASDGFRYLKQEAL